MKAGWNAALLVLYLAISGQPASAQAAKPANHAATPSKTFTDSVNGVSFTYPSVWTLSRQPSFYLPPLIVTPEIPAQAIAFFSPSGNLYSKTNLGGLEFTYVATPESTQASCLNRVTRNLNPGSRPKPVLINGTRFLHLHTEDAGLCHQARRDIYETFHDRSCLVLEAAFYTTCADPDDGIRQLTLEESRALSRHLDAVIQSVHSPRTRTAVDR